MSNRPPLILETATVSRNASNILLEAGLRAATELGFEAAVAIVDNGGVLKAFSRSDGAPFLAVDIAINKAWTAGSFGWPTHVWNDYVANPKIGPLAHHPRVMAVGGGYPLLYQGKLVGGIGVAGGAYEQDREAALLALKSAEFEVPT